MPSRQGPAFRQSSNAQFKLECRNSGSNSGQPEGEIDAFVREANQINKDLDEQVFNTGQEGFDAKEARRHAVALDRMAIVACQKAEQQLRAAEQAEMAANEAGLEARRRAERARRRLEAAEKRKRAADAHFQTAAALQADLFTTAAHNVRHLPPLHISTPTQLETDDNESKSRRNPNLIIRHH